MRFLLCFSKLLLLLLWRWRMVWLFASSPDLCAGVCVSVLLQITCCLQSRYQRVGSELRRVSFFFAWDISSILCNILCSFWGVKALICVTLRLKKFLLLSDFRWKKWAICANKLISIYIVYIRLRKNYPFEFAKMKKFHCSIFFFGILCYTRIRDVKIFILNS